MTADAAKRGLRSPVFPDGTFEFVPIKEESRFSQAEGIRSYSDLPSWTGRVRSLAGFLPERVRIPAEVEHGIRRKWNIDSGKWNTESGKWNTESGKWNSGSGGRERSSVA